MKQTTQYRVNAPYPCTNYYNSASEAAKAVQDMKTNKLLDENGVLTLSTGSMEVTIDKIDTTNYTYQEIMQGRL